MTRLQRWGYAAKVAIPTLVLLALLILMACSIKPAKAVEIGAEVPIVTICADRETIEESLDVLYYERSFAEAQKVVDAAIAKGLCMHIPRQTLPVISKGNGREAFTGQDGTVLKFQAIEVGRGVWSAIGEIVGDGT